MSKINTQLTKDDAQRLLAEIEKGQQLAGHFPSSKTMDNVRLIIEGKIDVDQLIEETIQKYQR